MLAGKARGLRRVAALYRVGGTAGLLCVVGTLGAIAQDQSIPPVAKPPAPAPAAEPAAASPAAPSANESKLPEISVTAAKPKPARPASQGRQTASTAPPARSANTTAPTNNGATPGQAALDSKMQAMDQARDNLLTKIGASVSTITREGITSLPQGDNTPIDKLVLQFPGVSYDSAVANPSYHVRNEYANVQTRINGIVLPEGVSGLGPFIDTNFIGSMSLLTGALPAQYGLRTAGVLDITSRSFSAPSGELSLYAGSRGTITPSFNYGGSVGDTQYFVTARGNWNNLGIENPTAGLNAIHDQTEQGKFFGYASTLIDPSTRFSLIAGAASSKFQIPNNPSQVPLGDFGPTNYNSLALNENEYDTYIFNMAAVQTKGDSVDTQLAFFSRYAKVHFVPDVFGDLVFNDVASNVIRQSELSGTQFDLSYRMSDWHTLRGGFMVTAEKTNVIDIATVLPVDPNTGNILPTPFDIPDVNSKLGWNLGGYVQDEWKLTDRLVINLGLRFDQLYQYVDANQFSPRVAVVYKPVDGTSLHAGYARYFTPPMQAQAAQSNISLFTNTTNQPEVPYNNPVLPERSHYFDVGVDQRIFPGLDVGIDTYYKVARDMIDDGQFGQAVVLTQFNWNRGFSEGVEFKAKYQNGNFKAYANFSWGIMKAIDAVSNQYLLAADEYNYLLNHYHYTDDMQRMSGSAGASYRWYDTLFTTSMTYGSGLRSGFANIDHTTPYAIVNVGITHDVRWAPDAKPTTFRFDVVNLLDQVYELRDGTGIGVFAPQFGARRGYFMGVSQKL
jgi:outer membrane receptor protein involved in Fe transport